MSCFLLKTHFAPLAAPGPRNLCVSCFLGMAGLVEITKPSCVLSSSRLSRLLCFKRNIFPFKTVWNPELWGGGVIEKAGAGVGHRRQPPRPPWAAPLPPTSLSPLGSGKPSSKSILKGREGDSGQRCSEVRNGKRAASEPAVCPLQSCAAS